MAASSNGQGAETAPTGPGIKPFELDETTLDDLQQAMKSGRLTSESITGKYLKRIEELDHRGPELHSVIEVNPDSLAIARELHRERKAKAPRGPLHGIPLLLKDNIDALPMVNSAGSLALASFRHTQDAFLVQRLRAALPGAGPAPGGAGLEGGGAPEGGLAAAALRYLAETGRREAGREVRRGRGATPYGATTPARGPPP